MAVRTRLVNSNAGMPPQGHENLVHRSKRNTTHFYNHFQKLCSIFGPNKGEVAHHEPLGKRGGLREGQVN